MTDAVDKVGGVTGLVLLAAARLRWFFAFVRTPVGWRARHWTLRDATDTDSHATDVAARSGGGQTSRKAIVLRFWTMAARWNSSRAPERPRSRNRSKPWWVFKCAKRISTRFLSSRDLANAFVFICRRATLRASSCRSRGILRAASLVQHLALRGQASQSRFEAR